MKAIVFATVALFLWQDLPYKAKEEFEIKLDYEFRQRSFGGNSTLIQLSESRAEYERRTSTDPLPYLMLEIKVLKLGTNEARVRIINSAGNRLLNKKAEEGMILPLDMGFTADLKDGVKPHEFFVYFLDDDKKEKSRIVINVDKEGNFFVNEEKRGRF